MNAQKSRSGVPVGVGHPHARPRRRGLDGRLEQRSTVGVCHEIQPECSFVSGEWVDEAYDRTRCELDRSNRLARLHQGARKNRKQLIHVALAPAGDLHESRQRVDSGRLASDHVTDVARQRVGLHRDLRLVLGEVSLTGEDVDDGGDCQNQGKHQYGEIARLEGFQLVKDRQKCTGNEAPFDAIDQSTSWESNDLISASNSAAIASTNVLITL